MSTTEAPDLVTRILIDPAGSAAGIRAVMSQLTLLDKYVLDIGKSISGSIRLAFGGSAMREAVGMTRRIATEFEGVQKAARLVKVEIPASFKAATPPVEQFDKAVVQANRDLQQTTRQGSELAGVMRNVGGAIAVGIAVDKAKDLVGGIIGIQSAAEDAKVGIAGMLAVQKGTAFDQQLGAASGVIAQLRKDAALGAGELSDYTTAFQQFVTPVLAAKGSLEDVQKLVRLSIGAGAAMRGQEGIGLGSMDVLQAMGGSLTAHQSQILGPLLGHEGLAKVRAADPAERLKIITAALERMDPAVKAAGQTWSAQMAAFKDNLSQVAVTATKPLYDAWSVKLREANEWLSANKNNLVEYAEVWGSKAIKVWDTMIERAKTLASLSVAGGVASAAGKSGMLSGIGTAVGGAGTAGIVAGGVALAAVAVAGFSVSTALQNHPELYGHIGNEFSRLAKSGNDLLAAVNGLAGAGGALDMLGQALVYLLTPIGWILDMNMRLAAFSMRSVGILWEGAKDVAGLGAVLSGKNDVDIQDYVFDSAGKMVDGYKDALGFGPGPADPGIQERNLTIPPAYYEAQFKVFGPPAPVKETEDKKKPKNVNFTGPITVNVQVEQAQDPYRVAQTMGGLFANIERFRDKAAAVKPR